MHELPRFWIADAMTDTEHSVGSHRRRTIIVVGVVVALLVVVVALVALSDGRSDSSGDGGTAETSATPAPPQAPPPPELSRPETAVYSYLLWISFAYRILNSQVASPTFTNFEEVRVDSYVQYNIQEGRAIDQTLLGLDIDTVTTEENTSTVVARESWEYRYIDIESGEYSSPLYETSYETTYTLLFEPARGWVVHKVAATPLGEVP